MDRFEHGLPDPQQAKVVALCANPDCDSEIYEGQYVDHFDNTLYCCTRCLFEVEGTLISAEGE